MLEYHQPSRRSLGIIMVRLCALLVLFSSTACQSLPMVSAPTTPTPFESQPIADGPVLLRADLTLRKVLEAGANNIRLVRNPANDDVYLLNPAEGIFRVNDISGSASLEKGASIRAITGVGSGRALRADGGTLESE